MTRRTWMLITATGITHAAMALAGAAILVSMWAWRVESRPATAFAIWAVVQGTVVSAATLIPTATWTWGKSYLRRNPDGSYMHHHRPRGIPRRSTRIEELERELGLINPDREDT